jgi:hypothetical protein
MGWIVAGIKRFINRLVDAVVHAPSFTIVMFPVRVAVCSFVGSALYLPVDTAAAQAAAITAAWRLHGCSVVLLEQLLQAPEVVAAVRGALVAGVRVIAAADGTSRWSEVMQLSQQVADRQGLSRQHSALEGDQQQSLEHLQHQLAAAETVQLMMHLSSIGGQCAVVECLPGYRCAFDQIGLDNAADANRRPPSPAPSPHPPGPPRLHSWISVTCTVCTQVA